MTRTVSAAFRNTIESPAADDVHVRFAAITHPALATPYRVNSDIVDYIYEGETWYGVAFSLSLISDDDQPPRAQASIPNVDQEIGLSIRLAAVSPSIDVFILAKSDFDDADPRVALGTPTVEYSALGLVLRNVNCDALGLTADIVGKDIASEPWPAIRSTVDRLPGLFARAPTAA